MPEYVYALHDFLPEHEDEVSFHAGERIEVVERDDLYGDGWWQGKNLAGKQGLFPQSYTAPAPPPELVATPASPSLQPLREETEAENGEVMKATMTDVQKAIEQLGRNHDGSRSFSFASTRDGDNTETDLDTDDGGEDHDVDGEDWHNGRQDARQKLAEASRRAVAEMEEQERAPSHPIELEMSDESEGEDDEHDTRLHHHSWDHPRIDEADEGRTETPEHTATPDRTLSPEYILSAPPVDDTQLMTATASQTSFPTITHTPASTTQVHREEQRSPSPEPAPPPPPTAPHTPPSLAIPISVPDVAAPKSPLSDAPRSPRSYAASVPSSLRESTSAPPAPAAAPITAPHSKHSSLASSSAKGSEPVITTPATSSPPRENSLKPPTHPTEWTVEEVVDWLKLKGFDQDVCSKFIEQEITGDVLMDLDANLLKTEIGIVAFGKRARIANAIADLRRPPSVNYAEQPHQYSHQSPQMHSPSPHQMHSPHHQQQHHAHAHTHSVVSSAPSTLNGIRGPSSPSGFSTGAFSHNPPQLQYQGPPQITEQYQPSPDQYQSSSLVDEFGAQNGNAQTEDTRHAGRGMEKAAAVLGMDFAESQGSNSKSQKGGRPAQLMLSPSPSDGALKAKAGGTPSSVHGSDAGVEDRGALSEGEASHTGSKRRRIFGRSADSSIKDKDTHSMKEGVAASSSADSPRKDASITSRHSRAKKSIDGGKPAERPTSIFGAFGGGGGVNKSRKPAPRYSSVESESTGTTEKLHGLSRIYGGSTSRKTSGRPSTADGGSTTTTTAPSTVPQEVISLAALKPSPSIKSLGSKPTTTIRSPKDNHTLRSPSGSSGKSDPSVLRKRTSIAVGGGGGGSSPLTEAGRAASGASTLKAGVSVLEQIGACDHNGWMRKKGDKFNSYKMRYFVLKGDYLYWLKSNSKAETKIKGVINIVGYKVIADEDANPGRYGFRIVHDNDKTHYFSSDEQLVIRDWMKAFMKATIGRDYTKPVISSCNIPTIPLTVAQAMNPAPRPPSPTARDATQKAMRRGDTSQLSTRDARVLMGIPSDMGATQQQQHVEGVFDQSAPDYNQQSSLYQEPPRTPGYTQEARTPRYSYDSSMAMATSTPKTSGPAPPRPSREVRRGSLATTDSISPAEESLVAWANSHLPSDLKIEPGTVCGGLELLRLAEAIKGRPCSPPVHDSEFPANDEDDKLDGLFKLFDFLLDNEIKMGTVSINDIKLRRKEKIVQLLKALRGWEGKRASMMGNTLSAGGFAVTSNIPWSQHY